MYGMEYDIQYLTKENARLAAEVENLKTEIVSLKNEVDRGKILAQALEKAQDERDRYLIALDLISRYPSDNFNAQTVAKQALGGGDENG